jgi:O-antigen/teichoic acid export membrane protein
VHCHNAAPELLKKALLMPAADSLPPERLRAELFWNLAAMLTSQGTTFLVSLISANLLGRTTFGELASIQGTLFALSNVAQLATWFTASKFVAEYRLTDPGRAVWVLKICHKLAAAGGAIAAIGLFLLAPWLSEAVYHAPHLEIGLLIAAATVLFGTINMFQLGALVGLEGHRQLAQAGIATCLIYVPASVVAMLKWGLNGALMALCFRFFLQWLIQGWLLRGECQRQGLSASLPARAGVADLLWRFSLPAAIAGCCSWPVLWLACTCVARQRDGFNEMAVYGAANSLRMITLFLPFTISNFAWSRLNRHRGLGDLGGSSGVFLGNLLITSCLVVGGAIGVVLSGPWLLPLFGKSFDNGQMVLLAMMIAAVPEALTIAAQQALHSHERIWRSLLTVAVPRDVAILALTWWLAPKFGALGLAMALVCGWSISLTSSLFYVWQVRRSRELQAIVDPAVRASPAGPRHRSASKLCRS